MGERVEWIEDPGRLVGTPLAAAWDRLAARRRSPFLRSGWFTCWWDAFRAEDRLAVCSLWRDEELAAVFPLSRHGDRLRALANVHTPLFHPLACDLAALDRIVAEVICSCSELEVFGLPRGDPSLPLLEHSAGAHGRSTLCEPQHLSPIVETAGDFASYLGEKRRGLRETERRRRKMQRESSADIEAIRVPLHLEAELERGLLLESDGWKGRGGTAILSSADASRFYRSIARHFHARGELRFSALKLDGHLAAFDLAILSDDRYWLLKTTYDESSASLGPGMALRLSVVERCFELGLHAHEFLGDDMPYKRRFATVYRAHAGFRAYRHGGRPLLAYAYRRHARPVMKRMYRRFRPVRVGRTA